MRQRISAMTAAALSGLGVWGALGCVVTAFAWELSLAPLAFFCVLFALLTAAFSFCGKKYWLYIGCAALVLVFSWHWDTAVATGMEELAYAITKDYRVCYPQVPLLFSHGPSDPIPALSFLWWLAAALLVLSSVLRRWFWPQVLLTLPLLCLPLAVTRAPGALPLLALGVFWLTALCTAGSKRREPVRAAGLQLYFAVLSALFLVAVGGLAGEAGTARPPWALQLQQNVLSWGERWGGRLTETVQNVPAAVPVPVRQNGRVDLSRQGPRSYTGRTMLELETGYRGVLYLRGAVSGAYTGGGWETPAETSETEALYFSAEAADGDTWTAKLTPRGDGTGVAYLPQYPRLLEGARMQGDQLALAAGSYAVTFRPGAEQRRVPLRGSLAEEEAAYAESLTPWTELPSETKAALRAWAQAQGLEAGGGPQQTAQRVADAVRTAAYYDLETPRQPAEEDFALYFLTTSRRGYCVHFATAATVLLRALGVPARYVQGYVLSSHGGVQMVPDSAAHAWTEYYVPGTGWLVLDATEGARAAAEGSVAAPAPQSMANGPRQEMPASSSRAEPEPPTVRFGTSGPEVQGAAAQKGWSEQATRLVRGLWRRFWAVPAALALAGLLWLRRRWVLLLRKRPPKSRSRAVLKSWRRQELLCRGEAPPGPEARRLAERAKFSNHPITQQELAEMLELERRRARLCAAEDGLLRRLVDRWLLCLY